MSKIGLIEYSRMSADEIDAVVFYGSRLPSKSLNLWWRVSYATRRVRARLHHWIDRWEMRKADGLYYGRTIAWKGRRIWWSQPNQPDMFNMWADGDWVEVAEPIRDVAIIEAFTHEELFIMTARGKNYRLIGNPSNPDSMRLERATCGYSLEASEAEYQYQ